MITKRLILACAALLALAVGCGDGDGDGMKGSMDGKGRCSARVSPSVITYQLTGDLLTLTGPDNDQLVVTREGDGSGLFDSWLAEEDGDGVIAQRAVFVLEPSRVRFQYECYVEGELLGVAEASSPALYTDTTIEILQADENIVYF
jgi:hypothetical protein